MYDMLISWVETGRGWVKSFNEDFKFHKLSDVTRDLRQMAERFEVVFGTFLNDWEEIICGPRNELQQCQLRLQNEELSYWQNLENIDLKPKQWYFVDLDWIIGYYEYLIFFLDRVDQALEWFSFTIGNILDATINKDQTTTTASPDF